MKNDSISIILKRKILKDLLNYNLSLKYILVENNVSEYSVRNILEDAMSKYSKYLMTLSKVKSFDEFKADANEGKYAFVLNDPI